MLPEDKHSKSAQTSLQRKTRWTVLYEGRASAAHRSKNDAQHKMRHWYEERVNIFLHAHK